MTPPADRNAVVEAATLAGGVLIGVLVAAKPVNDALFLSQFSVTALPNMTIAAALASLLVVGAFSRLQHRFSPGVVTPASFFLGAALLLAIAGLTLVSLRAAAVAFALFAAAFGAILATGFWSLVNECFDPHSARQALGRIGTGTAIGGLAGGLVAAFIGSKLPPAATLTLLALGLVFCGWRILALRSREHPPTPKPAAKSAPAAPVAQLFRNNPYLLHLGLFLFLAAVTAALLDYVFKAGAAARFTDAPSLMRFFSWFQIAVSVCTLSLQVLLGRRALERLGAVHTSALLPTATATTALGAVFLPGLASAGFACGMETVVRGSFFRAAFEMFYIPLPAADKRRAKAFIDVGFNRLGDAAGGGLTRLVLLLLLPLAALPALLAIAIVLSLVEIILLALLRRGYAGALETSLASRSAALDLPSLDDALTRTIVLRTLPGLRAMGRDRAAARPPEPAAALDPIARAVTELRSGNPERMAAVLREAAGVPPELAPQVLPLLARAELVPDVVKALNPIAERITGLLADALLDPDEDFAIRRRIPFILRSATSPRAVETLFVALDDARFETRFNASRVLSRLRRRYPRLGFERDRIERVIRRELAAPQDIWEGHLLLDAADSFCESMLGEAARRDRVPPPLEHVFALFALIHDPEPLRLALLGLMHDDALLRGTALEYLDVVLGRELLDRLQPRLRFETPRATKKPEAEQALENLLRSRAAIEAGRKEKGDILLFLQKK